MSKAKTFFEKCQERIGRLMDFTTYVNQSYMIIMMLRDIQYNHNESINISPAFYQLVIRNCMQSLFVDISKMFDKDPHNESVTMFLKKLQNNLPQLNSYPISVNEFSHLNDTKAKIRKFQSLKDLVDYYTEEIKKVQPDIVSLRTLRNKYYVHLDMSSQNDLDKLFKENSVSLATMEKLLILNTNICNALYMYFLGKTVIPLTSNYNDLYNTIFYLEKYKELSKKSNL